MLEIKSTVTEMKNAFDGLISRLDTAEERIFEHEDISTETFKMEKQREKRLGEKKKKQSRIELGDSYKRCNICLMEIPEGEERERQEERKFLKQ